MPPIETVSEAKDLPHGCHALGLYATPEEAAELTTDFLIGAPVDQAAKVFVPDEEREAVDLKAIERRAPGRRGSLERLPAGQVARAEGHLRPVPAVRDFVAAHPEGVTAAGDTLSLETSLAHSEELLEYESWFDEQPRERSRFMCPYDLRLIPVDQAPEFLRGLARVHSHVVLSRTPDPEVRLLQVFLFDSLEDPPSEVAESIQWAVDSGYLYRRHPEGALELTPWGSVLLERWSQVAHGGIA
jgi:hypothetical protein